MASPLDRPILLAIDGEPHTDDAVRWALSLGDRSGVELVALHVKNPYLKQFSTEIYAQGREEYLEHVDECMSEVAQDVLEKFEAVAQRCGAKWTTEVRQGEPLEELVAEVERGDYSVVVVGQKTLHGLAAWRSGDLASKLVARRIGTSVLVVAESG